MIDYFKRKEEKNMKKMKKLLALMMSLCMLAGGMSLTALAEGEALSAEVYVTIANKGTLEVVQEKVTVTDRDNDGKLTIDEALYAAHEAKYEGGAAAGYESGITAYGLSLIKLWGDASGSFGYYVDDASAWSLADEISNGNYITAFVYADGASWSDVYCYFDAKEVSTDARKDITLTLSGAGYDASYNPIVVPVAGAMITVDGAETGVTTDAEGKATIQIAEGGNHVISAKSATQILVPPVCKASVTGQPVAPQPPVTPQPSVTPEVTETGSPKTGDAFPVSLLVLFMGSALAGMVILGRKRKVSYEK